MAQQECACVLARILGLGSMSRTAVRGSPRLWSSGLARYLSHTACSSSFPFFPPLSACLAMLVTTRY